MKYYITPKFCKLLKVRGICLWPFGIFLRYDSFMPTLRNHEAIHWQQQKELPVIFYFWYLIEWGIKLIKYGKSSYYNISFEQEAFYYSHQGDYLLKRKRYNWLRYVFN